MKDLRDSNDLTIHDVQPINTHAAKQVQQEEKTLILLQAINDPDTMLAQAGSPGGSPHENKRHALVRPQSLLLPSTVSGASTQSFQGCSSCCSLLLSSLVLSESQSL